MAGCSAEATGSPVLVLVAAIDVVARQSVLAAAAPASSPDNRSSIRAVQLLFDIYCHLRLGETDAADSDSASGTKSGGKRAGHLAACSAMT